MFGVGSHPKLIAALAALGVILGAVYMLWMFQKVMFGPNSNPKNRELKDLSAREILYFIPIVAAAFWLGLHPATFLDRIDPAVTRTLVQFKEKYAQRPEAGDTPRMMPDTTGAVPVGGGAGPRPAAPALGPGHGQGPGDGHGQEQPPEGVRP